MSTLDQSMTSGLRQTTPSGKVCPGCNSISAIPFYRLSDQPVHVGVTYSSEAEARCAPQADIELCYCPGCGLVFNASYDATKMDFAPGYDASLTSSDQFMRFLDSIIERLIERYDLPGKTVLEVGCGIGHFLRRLCERAGCNGIGIDPSVPAEGTEPVGDQAITWIRGLLGPEYASLSFDLLCGLDMFELLPQPYAFLKSVRQALPQAGGMPVYFESPERGHIFDSGAGWSIFYEQCCYYDIPTLRGLFERSGFSVTHAAPFELNPQCVYVEAVAKQVQHCDIDHDLTVEGRLPANLAAFDQAQRRRATEWSSKIDGWIQAGRDVVLWGSGGKGINFLNTVPGAERIRRVVDVNPARQGRHLPRAGQQVIAPDALIESRPDVVLVSNRHWHDEIAGTITGLGLDCELLNV